MSTLLDVRSAQRSHGLVNNGRNYSPYMNSIENDCSPFIDIKNSSSPSIENHWRSSPPTFGTKRLSTSPPRTNYNWRSEASNLDLKNLFMPYANNYPTAPCYLPSITVNNPSKSTVITEAIRRPYSSSPAVEDQKRSSSPPHNGDQKRHCSPPYIGDQTRHNSPPHIGDQKRSSSPLYVAVQTRPSSPPYIGDQIRSISPLVPSTKKFCPLAKSSVFPTNASTKRANSCQSSALHPPKKKWIQCYLTVGTQSSRL